MTDKKLPILDNEFPAQAWGVFESTYKHEPLMIPRGKVGAKDIKLETLFAGICHSDIHSGLGQWGGCR